MAALDSTAEPEERPPKEPAASTSKLDSLLRHIRPLGQLFPDGVFVIVNTAMFILGVVLIILYAVSTVGPHLRYISVGLLTACAAYLIGTMIGLVLAIPRVLSSGAYRYQPSIPGINRLSNQEDGPSQADAELKPAEVTGGRGQAQTVAPRLLPSSNLSEISDWLTK